MGGEKVGNNSRPVGNALASVDEDAGRPRADEVGVGALEGEL